MVQVDIGVLVVGGIIIALVIGLIVLGLIFDYLAKYQNRQATFQIYKAKKAAMDRSEPLCIGCVHYNRCPIFDRPFSLKDIPWLREFDVKNCNFYKRKV